MPFASVGVWTVLWSNALFASATSGCPARAWDHIAIASSAVLRKNELTTFDPVTPWWRLTPSAIWSATIVLLTVRLLIGPSSQRPTFVWWMYIPSTVESLSAP